MVLAVSTNVSPFATLLPLLLNSTVSAPNLFAASEKLLRVRVLFSKKRLAQVFPVNSGTFVLQLLVTFH